MAVPRSAADRQAAVEARRSRRAEVTDQDVVMEAAAGFLAVRPRSVEEMRRRLRSMGFRASLADEVIDRLVELGYLDDRAFARAWVESRDRARPRGVLALRQELGRKGVTREVTDEILAERAAAAASVVDAGQRPGSAAPEAELAAALHLLARRERVLSREPDPRQRRQKAYALLARHGFTPDVCRQAMVGASDADAELLRDRPLTTEGQPCAPAHREPLGDGSRGV